MADKSVTIAEAPQTTMEAVGMGAVYDPARDTCRGLDGATVAAALSTMVETGTGADAAAILATMATLTEAGVGADGVAALVNLLLPDAAAGADSVLNVLHLHVYVHVDGTVDPLGVILLRGGRDDMLSSVRERTESIPGRPGLVDFGPLRGAIGLELRVASPGGLSPADLAALKRFVASWLAPTGTVWNIAWEDAPDRYLEVRVAGTVRPEEYAGCLEFTIPLKAARPMFLGSTLFRQDGAGTVTSYGTVEAPATVRIQGPAVNPGVTVGARSFTWTGALTGADVLVVDTERLTVTLNGATALAGFSGQFPVIQPGDNAVVAATTGTTTVHWRDRWV